MSDHSLAGRHAIVVGGGITGLAAARVLSDRGVRVTILERDAEPDVASPGEAFVSWKRRGAPQVRHSHAFLGRLRSLLRDRYPDLLESLLAAGAAELDMLERPPLTLPALAREPGDEDLVALGCRRTTFEWVLRHNVLPRPGVVLVSGAQMRGLLATNGTPPTITGVRYGWWQPSVAAGARQRASGRAPHAPTGTEACHHETGTEARHHEAGTEARHHEAGTEARHHETGTEACHHAELAADRQVELAADLVIDASGHHSKAPEWLAAIGAPPPREKLEPSGIIYYTRFYRFRDGAGPPPPSNYPGAADYNWIKYAIFPADDRTFSITFAIALAFPRLKVLARPAAFDEMARALPALAPWVAPEVAEPIGDPHHPVQAMGGLINRVRRFVVNGRPVAIGFFALGDAAYCTNPLYGRGCAQAFLHADLLGQALDAHPGDLAGAAWTLARRAREAIEPFYRASVIADRDAVRRAEGRRPRRLGDRLRQRFFEDGVIVATRCDPVVFRAFLRMFNMLESPERAFGSPRVIWRSLRVLLRGKRYNQRYAVPGPPDRETTIARCEAAAAG